ncbi:MAG: protein BatD [Verrucomicrobia bacterium]|nr:protein BatD [Verrucomicrobiota bacterium]
MRRLLAVCAGLVLGLLARAEDRVSWEITPRVTAPGQPFRLQIMVESDVVLGGAQFISREIKPPRGMALRLSGQIIRPDSNEATFNFSGVAPEQLGEHVIPSFNLRFARKAVTVPEIRLRVSDQVAYRREAQARAELVLPDRVFYVGELIRGAIRMRGGEDEAVVASYGLESLAEGFSMAVTAERQALPDELGQGLQTTFDLTPIREGVGEFSLNGIMLVQNGEAGVFNQGGRDRPFAFRRRLTVAHVPERGRPPEWNGAIGRFVAEGLQVSKDRPEVGEPIRLRAILTGDGNLDRILPPDVRGDETWDVLPATERRRHAEDQRMFVYTLVPRLPGKLRTPAVRLAAFDPATKTFSRLEFAPLELTVTGNAPAQVDLVTADPAAPAAAQPKAVTGLATPEPNRSSPFFRGSPAGSLGDAQGFWSANAAALGLVVAATTVTGVLGYLAAHPEIRRRRRARAVMRAALAEAEACRRRGDARGLAAAVVRGLQTGVAARLDAEDQAMTQSDVERVLPGADRARLDGLFQRAHADRFASAPPPADAGEADAGLALLRRLLATR